MADSSRTSTPLQIGTTALIALATGVMLYVAGRLDVERTVNFVQTGISTGAVLQVGGVSQFQRVPVDCKNATGGSTATGGLAKYDFCIAASPLSTTGTLLGVGLECGNVPKALTLSGGFVKSRGTAVTTAFQNFNDKSTASGAIVTFSTGANLWNPVDFLKIQTLGAAGTISANTNCQMWFDVRDKYGS